MNEFFGVLIGFLLWSLMGYVFSWYLLKFYDGGRFPMDGMSEEVRTLPSCPAARQQVAHVSGVDSTS